MAATSFIETASTSFVPGYTGITEHTVNYPSPDGAETSHKLYASDVAVSFLAEVARIAEAAGHPHDGWGKVQLDARVIVRHEPHEAGGEHLEVEIQVASASMTLPNVAHWVSEATQSWDADSVLPADSTWGAIARG